MTHAKLPPPSEDQGPLGPTDPLSMAKALAFGAAGGLVFFLLRMPLAWMMGAAILCTILALSGVRLGVQPRLRQAMLVVLGVMLGGGFAPDLLSRIGQWGYSIVALTALTALSCAAGYLFLRRAAGYDPTTAYFSAMPGGLAEMITVGGAMGGDERRISLAHAVRILTVVMTVPFWFRLHDGIVATGSTGVFIADMGWRDVAILVACGAIGAPLANLVRLPAANMLGPMALSALAHYFELTRSHPPAELVAAAQVVIGTAIGCRFIGMKVRAVIRDLMFALVTGALLVGVAALFSLAVVQISDLSFNALLLSFAPGGVAEMSLVALALGVDVAMVSAHHLFRIFLVVLAAPLAFRLLRRRSGGA